MNNNPPSYDTLFTPQPQYQYKLNYLQPNYIAPWEQPRYIYPTGYPTGQPANNLSYNSISQKEKYSCCILL
jgi:hypothetical protein